MTSRTQRPRAMHPASAASAPARSRVRARGRVAGAALGLLALAAPVLAAGPGTPAFVVDGGTRVTLSGTARLALDCDLRNQGVFQPAPGSEVVLTGFGAPLLTNVYFADLRLALHGTAAIATATSVTGRLTLQSGWLSLASHDLTVGTTTTGGSAASYVITPDTLGRLVRYVGAGADVAFPVGNASYNPVSIRTGIDADAFAVAVLDAPPTTGLAASEALTRAWLVRHTYPAGVNGRLTMSVQWNAAETGPGFVRSVSATNGAKAWRWSGATWLPQDNVRTWDNGLFPAVDTLVTLDAGLWTLAGNSALVAVDPGAPAAPRTLELASAFPNPAHGGASFRFGLPVHAHVTLALYSVLGERVATLADDERAAGWHLVRLEGTRLPAGMYFVRLQAGRDVRTGRLVVTR